MVKFSYVSPIGTAGLYYNATAVDFQQEGEKREMICELMREIVNLSHAMGIEFEEDLVERNLRILFKSRTGINNIHAERCYGRKAV